MESNPLHPFELHPYGSLSLFGLDISPNKAVVMMWIIIVLASSLLIIAARQQRLVPTRLQSLAEILVEFIRNMIMDTMGEKGMKFFPFVATLFVFILFCNILGLIPGSYTVTSQIVVTAAFALFVYSMSIIVGFVLHGLKFLGILMPAGTPVLLLPLMVPIELDRHLGSCRDVHSDTSYPDRDLEPLAPVCLFHRHQWPGSRDCLYSGVHFYDIDLRVPWRCHHPARACRGRTLAGSFAERKENAAWTLHRLHCWEWDWRPPGSPAPVWESGTSSGR